MSNPRLLLAEQTARRETRAVGPARGPAPVHALAAEAAPGRPARDPRVTAFLDIVRRRRTLILGIASAVIAATFVTLLVWPNRYLASATVVLEGRRNAITEQSAVLSTLPTDPASLQNQIQILTSRDLAAHVVDTLGLTRDEEFAPSPGWFAGLFGAGPSAEKLRNLTVDAFLSHLDVDVVGLSTTIEVGFASRDPEKAARIANAIADAYAAGQVSVKMEAASRAALWLSARVKELAAQVRDAEVAVQQYKSEHNLSDTPDGQPLEDQQVLAISSALVQARAELAQKEANAQSASALIAAGGADASQIVASPTIVALRQQQADLAREAADLSTRYGPRHPKMLQMESQRRGIETKINDEVRRIGGGLRNDVAAARTQVASLEASLARAQEAASKQSQARVELKALTANAQSTRTMYESFVTRLRETQSQEQIQTPDARVVSHASPPDAPASPKRKLIFAASIPAGLLLGLLVALLLERLQPAMPAAPAQTAAPRLPARAAPPPPPLAAERAGIPVLAEFHGLAKLAGAGASAADHVVDHPSSGFARAIAALDRQIATQGWKAPKVLAVTSAEPGTAKTNIALALARAAAQRGQRVMLIDGDAHWPAAAPMMKVKRPDGGIAEVVMGRARLAHSVTQDSRSSVMLLSWARRPARLRQLLASRRMHELMGFLRSSCDLIVIDTPPVLAAQDVDYTPFSDAVLFIAPAEARAKPASVRALGILESMRAPTIGIALTS
jgi:uncharacterized protein involved in exopolysaccharide biosynthesis/Mrp family chromosome partitioning ATPase